MDRLMLEELENRNKQKHLEATTYIEKPKRKKKESVVKSKKSVVKSEVKSTI